MYDDSGFCYTKYTPAMDGTSCGAGKVSYKQASERIDVHDGHH